MDDATDNASAAPVPGAVRLPSKRVAALLAAATLGLGIAIGAAVAPAPPASLGDSEQLARQLPLVLAQVEARRAAAARTSAAAARAAAASPEAPATSPEPPAATPAANKTGSTGSPSAGTDGSEQRSSGSAKKATGKLLAITNVWLIELSGSSFGAALADAAAAPYTTGTALGEGTLMKEWSAVDASAFASDTVLAEPPAAGATPPLLHTIVQPPCPEGAAGAACAPETPGQLTAADEFLKGTLATITSNATYKEHGLVVITYADVAIPTQSELPAGASSSTLSYQPAAGALLLSPFVKAGQRSAASFDTTSPGRSLEALLH